MTAVQLSPFVQTKNIDIEKKETLILTLNYDPWVFRTFLYFTSLLGKIGQKILDYFWKKTIRTSGRSRISHRGAPIHYLGKICRKLHENEDNWMGGGPTCKILLCTEYRFDDRTHLEKQFLSGRFVLVPRRLHALVHRLLQFVLDHSDVLVCALTSSLSIGKLKTN